MASFASPKWVPQMADAEEVLRAATKVPGIRPIVLVLNVAAMTVLSGPVLTICGWSSLRPRR